MSYQRIYPTFDDNTTTNINGIYGNIDSISEKLNEQTKPSNPDDEVEVLRDRINVLKQYVEQTNRIIDGLKKANAKQREALRKLRTAPRVTTASRNLASDLFLGCLIGMFLTTLLKLLEL